MLSWEPNARSLDDELVRVRGYYRAQTARLIAVLPPEHAASRTRLVDEIDEAGLLTHPYFAEWFNRQRANFKALAKTDIVKAFEELDGLLERARASEARRDAARNAGYPFDLRTDATSIPAAVAGLRAYASEAYGDKFPAIDILEAPPPALSDVVASAWSALREYWPEAAAEVERTTLTISFFKNDFLIGGASEAFLGGIFLTQNRATTPVQLAEEILHEASHARLFLTMVSETLWTNPEETRYETVLRRDSRPFWGLFHQLFVLTRLLAFYRRVAARAPEHLPTLQKVEEQARCAVKTVGEVGQLTPRGVELFESMRAFVEGKPRAATTVAVGGLPGIDGRALSDGAAVALYYLRYVKPGIFGWDDVVRFDVCWAPAFLEAQAREGCAKAGGPATIVLTGADAVATHLSPAEAQRRTRAAVEVLDRIVAEGLATSYEVRP